MLLFVFGRLRSHAWLVGLLLAPVALFAAEQVNVYSARHYDTDLELYRAFTDATGIEVNRIEGSSDALIERIVAEGEYTPADVLITVDAGRLWRAEARGVFQGITSDVLEQRVPAHLRHPDGLWFGLSKRARVIVVNADTALPVTIERYEDLADDGLRAMLCMRPSSNIYNLSLLASIVDQAGADAAEAWAAGVVNNFARPPQGNDSSNLAAVAAGECAVTLANTYYLGRFLAASDQRTQQLMDSLRVIFPNQADRGTHVNISGAGVTRHAPNKANAIRFLEYLTSAAAQQIFAEGNNEYPVVGETTGPISALGSFREDQLNASRLGVQQSEAVRIYDRAGWR